MDRGWLRSCLVVGILGLFLLGGLAVLWFLLGRPGAPLPTVQILQPAGATTIRSGQGVVIIVEGRSALGLDRIDFFADGQPERSIPASGAATYQAVFPWFSSGLGQHVISAVGYDRAGQASPEVSVSVQVDPADVQALMENALPMDIDQPIQQILGPPESGVPAGGASEGALPPSGEQLQQPADPAGNPPAEPPLNDPGGNAPGDAGANPPVLEEPPQADREPPTATLTVAPLRLGDSVSAVVQTHARDNAGLRILLLQVRTPAGVTNSYGLGCEENLECGEEIVVPLTETGRWVFVLQATDLSGQNALAPPADVHVLCVEGLGCALAQEQASSELPPSANWRLPILGERPVFEPLDAAQSWVCRGLDTPQESYTVERSTCRVILPVDLAQNSVTQCPGDILQQRDFRGVDLRQANFFGANLEWADLTCGADLRGANLGLSHLFGTRLDASTRLDPKWRLVWELVNAGGYFRILRGEDLSWAYLYNADLYGSDLKGANLSAADLSHATLLAAEVDERTNLDDVIWNDTVCPDASNSDENAGTCLGHMAPAWPPVTPFWIGQCRIILPVNLALGPYTDCPYADMFQADLRAVDLRKAKFEGTNFGYADLRGTNLAGADLRKAWLKYSKIDIMTQLDAKWRLAWKIVNPGVRNQDLRGADLQSARLVEGQLAGANLTGADFGYADLTRAQMANATLVNANFTAADLTGADLSGADTRGAVWHQTTCPDGAFSDRVGDSCEGHLNR